MTAGRKIVSENHHWGTPKKYVDAVKDFFGDIELDPCSNEASIVQARVEYLLPAQDGLRESWDFSTIYVNPPYGRDPERGTSILDWVRRCAEAHQDYGSEVLALIPVAVNTKHWKLHIFGVANSVCFLADTRLKFINGGNDKGAPMACAVVYWGTRTADFYRKFSSYGAVVELNALREKGWVSPDQKSNSSSQLF